jgi:uncharacterized SAM-binding protein YcdF (DUF218 family)
MSARRVLRAAFLVPLATGLASGLAWTCGFVWFLTTALREPEKPPRADGIVVLTGGAERIETGLRLLAAGQGRLLLVTGIGRSVRKTGEFDILAQRAGVDPALAARATLGRDALDTHGNAVETAAWARGNDIHSLIVVTAGYHMPRALAELSRTLPEVALHPYPVLSPVLRAGPGAAALRLLATEYTKYLAVAAGLPVPQARAEWHAEPGEDHSDGERRGG